jgi:hypothetical protein
MNLPVAIDTHILKGGRKLDGRIDLLPETSQIFGERLYFPLKVTN